MSKQSLQSEDLKSKKDVAFICEGSCNAQITQEQYDGGLTKCGAKECTLYGKPFKRVERKTIS